LWFKILEFTLPYLTDGVQKGKKEDFIDINKIILFIWKMTKTILECWECYNKGIIMPFKIIFRKASNPEKNLDQLAVEYTREQGKLLRLHRISFWCGAGTALIVTFASTLVPIISIYQDTHAEEVSKSLNKDQRSLIPNK